MVQFTKKVDIKVFKKRLLFVFLVFSVTFLILGYKTYNNNYISARVAKGTEIMSDKTELEKQRKANTLHELRIKNNIEHLNDVEIRQSKTNIFRKLNNGEKARIVFLGDSTTKKNKYTNGKPNHVDLINKALSEIYGSDVEVINSGVSGDTIEDMISRLDSAVLNYSPDLVIINTGINDATKNVPMDIFEETYRKVIEQIRDETDAEILLRTSNPTLGPKTNEILSERINPIVNSLAKEYDLGFVDLYNYYLTITSSDLKGIEKYNYDNKHPNELGQAIIGNLLLRGILLDAN